MFIGKCYNRLMQEDVQINNLRSKEMQEKGIRNMVSVSEEYVILQWALGEARNPKWKRREQDLSERLRKKIHTLSPVNFENQLSKEERENIANGFFKDNTRTVVKKILQMKCSWYKGFLPIEELENLYMVMWPLSEKLSPSAKLSEYSNAFVAGKFPSDATMDFENIQRMRETFDPSQMIGAPVLLSQSNRPPFCAIDGITRLSVMQMKLKEGSLSTNDIPIILGISDNIFDWDQIPRQMKNSIA